MKKIEIELFTNQGNGAILKLPNRKYPGVLIQGDSLSSLSRMINLASTEFDESNYLELKDSIMQIKIEIDNHLKNYENILIEEGIEIPYLRNWTLVDCEEE